MLSRPVVLEDSGNQPTAVFSVPLSLWTSAAVPIAVFLAPVVFSKSAAAPTAVLDSPLLSVNAPAPTAVLKLASLSEESAYQPTAVFAAPVVRLKRALVPSAVVKFGSRHPAGGQQLALRVKAQCRQSRSECELTFEVSYSFFLFTLPLAALRPLGVYMAFCDFSLIGNAFRRAYYIRRVYAAKA